MAELNHSVVDRIVRRLTGQGWSIEAADVQLVYDTGTHSSDLLAAAIIEQLQEYGAL